MLQQVYQHFIHDLSLKDIAENGKERKSGHVKMNINTNRIFTYFSA